MNTHIHVLYLARFFLELKMFHIKVVENIKAHFYSKIVPFEIMLKKNVERGKTQMAIWYMHMACWIP